jgi:Chaperone of endosialidase
MPQAGAGGKLGINTTTPRATLDVEGLVSLDYTNDGFAAFAVGLASGKRDATTVMFYDNPNVSIYASADIMGLQIDAFSDARIKNIKGKSDPKKDLETLMAIQVTDYTLKDKIKYGSRPTKKVIAQQVETVYPQVVSKHVDFIPNVYQTIDSITKVEGGYRLHFLRDHHLGDTATRLEALLGNSGSMQSFNILSIPSPTEVVIDAKEIKNDKIFVYGEEVPDFRTVDYEGLTTLNISATQELSKKVERLEKALATANKNILTLAKMVRQKANPPVTNNRLTSTKVTTRKSIAKPTKQI